MDKHYQSLIFTTHALERLKFRSITQAMVHETILNSDRSFDLGNGKKKFVKLIKDRKIQVIAQYTQPDKKWLIISVWVRGEEDKLPLIWQILALPFVLLWKLINLVIRSIWKF